jgi:hypothetical protein
VIVQQNYFTFQEQIYQPDKGIAMGSHISGIIAEIFLQHVEHTHIKPLLDSKHLMFYSRYVDSILIIYEALHTKPDAIVQHTNSIQDCLQLKPTPESNSRISSLDLSIIRKPCHLEIDIYRKPTTTNTTISFLSNHPNEHTLAAYRYYIQRMLNLPLNKKRQHREWQTIFRIEQNNKFPTTLLQKLKHQVQHKIKHTTPLTNTDNKTKWATFTFISPHICRITNIFKHSNVKVAFRCHNTIAQLTKPPNDRNMPPHNKWGIYQLTRNSCNLSYVGQTSRSLKIRFQEHIRYIRNNNPQSTYAQHILHNQHELWPDE